MKFNKGLGNESFNRLASLRKEAAETIEKVAQEDNYRADIKSYAQELKERFAQGDVDEMSDAVHETVDGSLWIIYYSRNLEVLNNTRHEDNIAVYWPSACGN